MEVKLIGKVVATEKAPSTVDEFYFWTKKTLVIRPFDVVKVNHIKNSITYGVVEEISHITDSASSLAGYISSDFGEVEVSNNTDRIGMNYVKARVVGNSENVYTPVLDGHPVSLANQQDIENALGLSGVKNKLPCGYIEMYDENPITVPVYFDSHFLIGPEGAHLNISGISGLASKTSYAMFLLKAIQDAYSSPVNQASESVAFVIFNVKGRDLLALDELNEDPDQLEQIYPVYDLLGIEKSAFKNVKYFYPYSKDQKAVTAGRNFENQFNANKAFKYKYTYEQDRSKLDMLFANIDDPSGTMESIVAHITSKNSEFYQKTNWFDFKELLAEYKQKGETGKDKEISVLSWRKFSRHLTRTIDKSTIFDDNIKKDANELRLEDAIKGIQKNEVFVVDIAKLDEETQGFVFGDVINSIYDLKIGANDDRDEDEIPSRIVIFIDELNKYASTDVPRGSSILRKVLEVTERGRSLGVVLFGAEQFKSNIHDRVKGNCATHTYGRTNAIELSKNDYKYIPSVYKSMMTRLEPGEYILQHPVFRSLLNIKFPRSLSDLPF